MGELANKTLGKTKKAMGRAAGDRDVERQGRRQETTGKVQGGVRKAGRAVNRGIDKVARKADEASRRRGSRPTATRRSRATKETAY